MALIAGGRAHDVAHFGDGGAVGDEVEPAIGAIDAEIELSVSLIQARMTPSAAISALVTFMTSPGRTKLAVRSSA